MSKQKSNYKIKDNRTLGFLVESDDSDHEVHFNKLLRNQEERKSITKF